jgi:hypothetical protein
VNFAQFPALYWPPISAFTRTVRFGTCAFSVRAAILLRRRNLFEALE